MKTLQQAVIEQYGTREEFLEAIPDIMQGGASAGVSGLNDTQCTFTQNCVNFLKCKRFDTQS